MTPPRPSRRSWAMWNLALRYAANAAQISHVCIDRKLDGPRYTNSFVCEARYATYNIDTLLKLNALMPEVICPLCTVITMSISMNPCFGNMHTEVGGIYPKTERSTLESHPLHHSWWWVYCGAPISCSLANSQYTPFLWMSSSCRPFSIILPWSNT